MTAGAAKEGLPDHLLDVTDLHRSFGGVRAVDGVSLGLKRGQITGLIGPNGAGKSTVISVIAGALKPTSGSICLEGQELAGMPSFQIARRGVARTFQLPSEFDRLTVLENLLVAAPRQKGESLWGALLGKRFWRDQELALVSEARALLERFEMGEKESEYAGHLSGGQKRLLEVMRALILRPKLLLLDEPMVGVNPSLARRIEYFLQQLRDEGYTMLIVEHELGVVQRLCDEVVVMAQGKVIFRGTMTEVQSNRDVQDAYLVG